MKVFKNSSIINKAYIELNDAYITEEDLNKILKNFITYKADFIVIDTNKRFCAFYNGEKETNKEYEERMNIEKEKEKFLFIQSKNIYEKLKDKYETY